MVNTSGGGRTAVVRQSAQMSAYVLGCVGGRLVRCIRELVPFASRLCPTHGVDELGCRQVLLFWEPPHTRVLLDELGGMRGVCVCGRRHDYADCRCAFGFGWVMYYSDEVDTRLARTNCVYSLAPST